MAPRPAFRSPWPPAEGVLANDSDPDGDSMTASLVSGPSSGTLDFNSDGSFVYTPSASFFGSISFTYQVTAGGTDRHGHRHHHRDLIGVRSWKRNPLQC